VGEELDTWKRLGAQRIVCVEANPAVYQQLLTTIAGARHVIAVNCAASDHVGRITLRVTSSDQSSSILPLARHLDLYPDVVEVSTVEVPCTTVDQLLTDQRLPASAFNVLSIDIQGAELLALRGAERTLPSIEAINLEVNFDELYKGAPQIEEIEEFLGARGFSRAALTCPFHATWGDALYIRTAAAPPPPPLVHPDWLKGWR
jgi:FkbM family methyltransferase